MKKLFTVFVLVLLVSLSLFASNDISIRAGGAFNFLMGKTSIHAKNSDEVSGVDFESLGFGFNVGVDFDLTDALLFYLDFSMTFPPQVTIANAISPSDVEKGLNEAKARDAEYKYHTSNTFFSQISAHVGFGHTFKISEGSFAISAGVGFGINRIDEGFKMVKIDGESNNKPYYYADFRSVTEFSIGLYGNARYRFSDNFSVVLTAMPDLGVFTIARHVVYNKLESENYTSSDTVKPSESSGFALSFAAQATVGVSYTF